MEAKGIILAGGAGTRLWPATESVVKQLLPIYDKPMIYYPLTTLMSAGVRQFLIISQSHNRPLYRNLLGDGSELGISVRYAAQNQPKGIAQALTIADDCGFLDGCKIIVLILGDNLFAGQGVTEQIQSAIKRHQADPVLGYCRRATIFTTEVKDPERYGVAVFVRDGSCIVELIEKPPAPSPSNWAVTGLYIYDGDAPERVRKQKPSARGELEITDLNKAYHLEGKLQYRKLGRGTAWLDTGTPDALLQATAYVEAIQSRHGIMLGCPEEAALNNDWVTFDEIERRAARYRNEYGDYLRALPRC